MGSEATLNSLNKDTWNKKLQKREHRASKFTLSASNNIKRQFNETDKFEILSNVTQIP